ncbi:MAG: hypothetical protein RLZZ387_4481 [Chloroflexota bacterium]
MFVLRPVPHHFAIWLLLAPLLLVEMYTLDALQRVVVLQSPGHARTALAEIVERRDGAQGPEVRYRFRVPGREEQYFARGAIGGGGVWVPISQAALADATQRGELRVVYLPEDPWTNQPVGRLGHPVADSFCLWGLFLLFDLVWVAESFVIARNYVRAQAMVERRTPHRARFWESRRIPDPRFELKGW